MDKGSILAMPDTDQVCFAGTGKVVFEACAALPAVTVFGHTTTRSLLIKS